MDTEGPTSSAFLSQDLLAHVLSRVPLRHRVADCAAVSIAWRAAAATATCATGTIEANLANAAQCESLTLWLQQHAACAALQHLSLSGPNIETLDSAGTSSAGAACGEHPGPSYPALRLPIHKLPNLSSLSLNRLRVAAVLSDSSSGGSTTGKSSGAAGSSNGGSTAGSSSTGSTAGSGSITGSGYLDEGVSSVSSAERDKQLQKWRAWDKQERLNAAALKSGRKAAARKAQIFVLPLGKWLRSAAFAHLRCLKKLKLSECAVNLHGLEQATALEDLTLDCVHELSWAGHSVSSKSNRPAFLQLGQLTKLQLCDMPYEGLNEILSDRVSWNDKQLELLASLLKLQDLDLSVTDASDTTVDVLPLGLTRLKLDGFWGGSHAPYFQATVHIRPETCPSFAGLKNLQHLDVSDVEPLISPSMLKDMTGLTCLKAVMATILWDADAPAATFGCWSGLTCLQHLDLQEVVLPRCTPTGEWEPDLLSLADCAALTASTRLTMLDLGAWELSQEQCSAVFPPGRILPNLKGLVLGPCFFDSAAAAARIAACCPGVTYLVVAAVEDHGDYVGVASYDDIHRSIGSLAGLQELTSLDLVSLEGLDVGQHVWQVLAQLIQLEDLTVDAADIAAFAAAMQLTTCRALQEFNVRIKAEDPNLGFAIDTAVKLSNSNLLGADEDGAGNLLRGAPNNAGNKDDQGQHADDPGLSSERVVSSSRPAVVWLALPTALAKGFLGLYEQAAQSKVHTDIPGRLADEWSAITAAADAFKLAAVLELPMQELSVADDADTAAGIAGVGIKYAGTANLMHKVLAKQLRELHTQVDGVQAAMATRP